MRRDRDRNRRNVLILSVTAVSGLAMATLLSLSGGAAEAQQADSILDRRRMADIGRLEGLADHYLSGGRCRARRAEAARLTALAKHVLNRRKGGCAVDFRTRAQEAEATRLVGQAEYYLGIEADRRPIFNRGRIADSLRLAGIAAHLGVEPSVVSNGLACLAP